MNKIRKLPQKIFTYFILAVFAISLGLTAYIALPTIGGSELKAEAGTGVLRPNGSRNFVITPESLKSVGNNKYEVRLAGFRDATLGSVDSVRLPKDDKGTGDNNAHIKNGVDDSWLTMAGGEGAWGQWKIPFTFSSEFASVPKTVSLKTNTQCWQPSGNQVKQVSIGRNNGLGGGNAQSSSDRADHPSTPDYNIGTDNPTIYAILMADADAGKWAWNEPEKHLDATYYNIILTFTLPGTYGISMNNPTQSGNDVTKSVTFSANDDAMGKMVNSWITLDEKLAYEPDSAYKRVSSNFSRSGTTLSFTKTYTRNTTVRMRVLGNPLPWSDVGAVDRTDTYNISGFYENGVSARIGGSAPGGGEISAIGTNGVDSGHIVTNDQLSLSATPKSGYYFSGWYVDNTLISTSPNYTYSFNKINGYNAGANRVFVASFEKIGTFDQVQHFRFTGQQFAFDSSSIGLNPVYRLQGDTLVANTNLTNGSAVGTYIYKLRIMRKHQDIANMAQQGEVEVGYLSNNKIVIDPLLLISNKTTPNSGYNSSSGWSATKYTMSLYTGSANSIVKDDSIRFQFQVVGNSNWVSFNNSPTMVGSGWVSYNITQDFDVSVLGGNGAHKVIFRAVRGPAGTEEIGRTQTETTAENGDGSFVHSNIITNLFLDNTDTTKMALGVSGNFKEYNSSPIELELYLKTAYEINLTLSGTGKAGAIIEFQLGNSDTNAWRNISQGEEYFTFSTSGYPSYGTGASGDPDSANKIYKLLINRDCKYLIKFRATAGNNEFNVTTHAPVYAVYLDSTAPKNTLVTYPGLDNGGNNSENGWVSSAGTGDAFAEFTFTDTNIGTGVKSVRVTKEKGGDVEFVLNGTNCTNFADVLTVIDKYGVNTIKIKLVDADKYIVTLIDFIDNTNIINAQKKVDATRPTINGIEGYQGNVWTNEDITFTLNIDCGPSGVRIFYKLSDGSFVEFDKTRLPQESIVAQPNYKVSFTITAEQNQNYKFYARSQAGLMSEVEFSLTLQLDKTAVVFDKPTLSESQINTWSRSPIGITFGVTDNGIAISGIKTVTINNNGIDTLLVLDGAGKYSFNIENALVYTITAVDNAGNTVATTYKARVDMVETVITVEATKGNSTTVYDFNTWLNIADSSNGFVKIKFNIKTGGAPFSLFYKKGDDQLVQFLNNGNDKFGNDGFVNNFVSQDISYVWDIRGDQNSTYKIKYTKDNSIDANESTLGSLAGAANNNIKIDTIATSVSTSYVAADEQHKSIDIDKWTYHEVLANFVTTDLGSGIEPTQSLYIDSVLQSVGNKYTFASSKIGGYEAKIVDRAGNPTQFTISPKIDKFDDFKMTVENKDIAMGNIPDDKKWRNTSSQFVFSLINNQGEPITYKDNESNPSGLQILYSIGGDNYSNTFNIKEQPQTIQYDDSKTSAFLDIEQDQSYTYRFKLVTGAGREFTMQTNEYWGVFKDSTPASISYSANADKEKYSGAWTYKNIIVDLATSKSESGVKVEYLKLKKDALTEGLSQEELLQKYKELFSNNTSSIVVVTELVINKYAFSITINKDCQDDIYIFRVTTGAGTATYNTRTEEESGTVVIDNPLLVNIDTVVAYWTKHTVTTVDGKAYDGEKFVSQNIKVYIEGATAGPSGYSVMYANYDGPDGSDIKTLFSTGTTSGSVTFADNQDNRYQFAIISGAGLAVEEAVIPNTFTLIETNVKIDKAVATFDYAISGTQLSSGLSRGWYTSDATVTLSLTSEALISGHTFQYALSDDNERWGEYQTTDIQNNGQAVATLIIKTNKSGNNYYRFRIISGAEVVGSTIHSKQIQVDTTEYIISTEQFVGQNKSDTYSNILEYVNEDTAFPFLGQLYKRGEIIKVSIKSNEVSVATDSGNEILHHYLKTYQLYNGTMLKSTVNWDVATNKITSYIGDTTNIEITDFNVTIKQHFVREVLIKYVSTEQYIQKNTIVPVTTINFEKDFENKFTDLAIVLRYYYYDEATEISFNKIATDKKIGQYRVEVGYNTSDYIILGQDNKHYLNLSYFAKSGTANDVFVIDSPEAFNHIDYYMTNDAKYSYLKKQYQFNFLQDRNLAKEALKKLQKPFNGVYDGGNYEIASKETNITEGIFGKINGGTVQNLGVVYNLTSSKDVVGLLADEIVTDTANGIVSTLENVYVIGVLKVTSVTDNSRIGGIAGVANGLSLSRCYVDVTIDQVKSATNSAAVYVGGVFGSAENITFLNNLFVLSTIAISNLPNAKVGSVFGYAPSFSGSVSNVNVLKNNLTVNSELKEAVSHTSGTQLFNANFVSFANFNTDNTLIANGNYINTSNKLVANLSVRKIVDSIRTNSGSGTVADEIQLKTEADLELLNNFPYANFKLVANIKIANNQNKIYNSYKVFSGKLTGKITDSESFSISNFNYKSDSNNSSSVVAFIAYSVGIIENVNLLDVDIKVDTNYTKDEITVGALVGVLFNGGSIKDSIVSGYIVINKIALDVVVGGAVGKVVSGKIENLICLTNLNVESAAQLVAGGVIGVINNISGQNTSNIANLYSLSKVSAVYNNAGAVGNVIGYAMNESIIMDSVYFIKNNTFIDSKVNNIVIGYNKIPTLSNLASYTYNEFINRNDGRNIPIKDIVTKIYPFQSGIGTAENPFVIVNEEQLSNVSNYLYATYKLGASLTLSDNFETLGKGALFTGTFSGNVPTTGEFSEYYSISNLRVPLFESNDGLLTSFKLNVVVMDGANFQKVSGRYVFGSVAKYNYGEINTITLSGKIHIASNSLENVTVGAIVGVGYGGSVKSCINGVELRVNAIYGEVGGIIGRIENFSIIENNTNVEAEHGITASDIIVNGNVVAGLIVGVNKSSEAIIKPLVLHNSVIINGVNKGSEYYIGYDLYSVLK